MKYLKFEFADRKDMINKLADYFDKEGNPINCAVVELGNIVITPATFDKEGNELTAAIVSEKYAVDVLFNEKYPELAEEVTPEPCGIHTFAGLDKLYLERYKEKNK